MAASGLQLEIVLAVIRGALEPNVCGLRLLGDDGRKCGIEKGGDELQRLLVLLR